MITFECLIIYQKVDGDKDHEEVNGNLRDILEAELDTALDEAKKNKK